MTFRDLFEAKNKRVPSLDFSLQSKDLKDVKKTFSKTFKNTKELDKAVATFFINKINAVSRKEGGESQSLSNVKPENTKQWKKEIKNLISTEADTSDFESFLSLI